MRRGILAALVAVAFISALFSAFLGGWAAQQAFNSFSHEQQRGMGGPARRAEREAAIQRNLNWAHLLSGLLSAGAAVALGTLLAGRLARPLRQLEAESRRYAQGATDLQLPTHGEDEVAHLARAFGDLTQQLAARRAREQAMLSEIAHELRAPLTVLKSNLEALEDGVYPATPQRYRELSQEVEGLSRLVADLRTLTLADANSLPLTLETVDLAEITLDYCARMQVLAEQRGVRLAVQTAPAPVRADQQRLGQVLTNLLDNALRHTPAGGAVQAEVRREGNRAILSVSDSGPGLPPGEEELVFERFYRTDIARSREDGGSGLGLAIVRSIVQLHGGTVQAANLPPGGATFEVRLPLAIAK